MKYLLDTNICIYLLNGNTMLKNKVNTVGIFSLALSNSILAELYFGAYKSAKVETNLSRIELFKKDLMIFSDSEESAKIFGKIKADLQCKGKPIEDFDILNASVAISSECVLVTNNLKHFARIDGLQMENWLEL